MRPSRDEIPTRATGRVTLNQGGRQLRVAFMGTPEFAVPSLHVVAETTDLVAVYTRPDAVSGRGKTLLPSAVKTAALAMNVPVLQPTTLRDIAEHQALRDLRPDLVVVAAYGLILPREILETPPLGAVNVHASLLPRWRGAAPVQRAILAKDSVTGVSIMKMKEGLDTGPYCETERVEIADKDAPTLTAELAEAGALALRRALAKLAHAACDWTPQDDSAATYAEKVTKADVALAPALTASDALLRVRASSAQAPSRLVVEGRGLTVVRASTCDAEVRQGGVTYVCGSPCFGFRDGALAVHRVKPDGRSEMDGSDWWRGSRLGEGSQWEEAR